MFAEIRVGLGYDVHAFCSDRKLILGGIELPFEKGLKGHSDADVLIHSIVDSLLGASDSGDIGKLFPDTDPSNKDLSSLVFLRKAFEVISEKGWKIMNIDSVIVCEKPKIAPFSDAMKKVLSENLGHLGKDRIGLKGKTSEKLGFTGRGEGIAVQSVALLYK